jgi:hypothetical protein
MLMQAAGMLLKKLLIVVAIRRNRNMNSKHCNCDHSLQPLPTNESKKDKKPTGQGFTGYIKMAIPVFAFVIIPKCPVCLAGYIALITGAGLSIPAATYMRTILIILCIVSFSYFIIKHVQRWLMDS